jgi:3-methyladenine DNA glycosylase AlkC
MEPLKEMFNREFYKKLSAEFANIYSDFDAKGFFTDVTKDMNSLELNGRMRNTSVFLNKYLPQDFRKTIAIMKEVIPNMQRGYTSLVFPDYVGLYGLDHFDSSMDALQYFTSFGSSEFAIREFLRRDFNTTIKVMYKWSTHDDHHVRRLSSEGSRPRLPWSFKLDDVIANPAVTQPILENLRADTELYVKKSVANHLNDLSKDSPSFMLNLVKAWDHSDPHTSWIVKRACRNLIKQGDKTSLSFFAFEKNVKVAVPDLRIDRTKVRMSESLEFSFTVESKKSAEQKIVVDYQIHYRKKSGGTSPKIFKLREIRLAPRQKVKIVKRQQFKDLTTRKHFPGIHSLEILINGKVMAEKKFSLAR